MCGVCGKILYGSLFELASVDDVNRVSGQIEHWIEPPWDQKREEGKVSHHRP